MKLSDKTKIDTKILNKSLARNIKCHSRWSYMSSVPVVELAVGQLYLEAPAVLVELMDRARDVPLLCRNVLYKDLRSGGHFLDGLRCSVIGVLVVVLFCLSLQFRVQSVDGVVRVGKNR